MTAPDVLVLATLPPVGISLSLRTFIDHPNLGRIFPADLHRAIHKWRRSCPDKLHITHIDDHDCSTDSKPTKLASRDMLLLSSKNGQFKSIDLIHTYAITEFGKTSSNGNRIVLSGHMIDTRPRKLDFLRGIAGLKKGKRVVLYYAVEFRTVEEAINQAMTLSGYDVEFTQGELITPPPRYSGRRSPPPNYIPHILPESLAPLQHPRPHRAVDLEQARRLARSSFSRWNGESLDPPQPPVYELPGSVPDEEITYEEADEEVVRRSFEHRLPPFRNSMFLPLVPQEENGPSSR